ncbi:MAG: hypothetical protein JWR32_3658, partial [Mycobacterium sp.]|nr:hypothetical protein [Mycobacterium sp.]
MVGGLGWMLSQHLVTQNVRSRLIALLPGMLTFIVIVTTSLLLVRTTINYLDVLSANFQRPYPDWVEPVLWWFYKVYFVAILAMIAFRSFGIWT